MLAARDRIKGSFVIIPSAAFKSDEPVMLDGFPLHDLQKQLGLPLHALDFSGFTALLKGA